MSKYIIEIKPEYEDSFKGLMILGAKDSNLFVDTLAVENLEELNSDYINEHFGDLQDDAYNKGYAQCQDDYSDALKHAKDTAYKKGFEDGKAVNDKGCEGCKYDGGTVGRNPCISCCNYYQNYWTAKKQDDEIKVGDEVITPDGTHFVVFEVGGYFGDDAVGTFILFGENNSSVDIKAGCFSHSMTLIAKTGRHFDIDKILAEMRT